MSSSISTLWLQVLSQESILESSCTTDPVRTALEKFQAKHLCCRSLRCFDTQNDLHLVIAQLAISGLIVKLGLANS